MNGWTFARVALLTGLIFVVGALCAEMVLRLAFEPTRFLNPMSNQYWIEFNRVRLDRPPRPDANVVHDELLGWRMKPDFTSRDGSHDQYGFRLAPQATDFAATDMLFIGDSFTYGLGVEDHETFAYLIDQALPANAINAAVNAYGFDQAYLTWETLKDRLNVDVVIAGYMTDDFFRNSLMLRDSPKPYFVETPAGFELYGQPVLTRQAFFEEHAELTDTPWQLKLLIDKVVQKVQGVTVPHMPARIRLSNHILGRLHASVEAHGAKLVVLIFGHCDLTRDLEVEQAIVAEADALGIEYFNFGEQMRALDNFPAMYLRNCHYSSAGHRFVADQLLQGPLRHEPP